MQIAVELASGFLLAPVLLKALGPGQYGAWVIMNSTTALLALLDLGLRGTQYRSICMNNLNPSFQRSEAGLFLKVLLVLASVAAAMSIGSGAILPHVFPALEQAKRTDFFIGMCIFGLTHAVAFVATTSGPFLAARDRMDLNSLAGLIGTITRLAFAIAVAKTMPSLTALAVTSLIGAIIHMALNVYWAGRSVNPLLLIRESSPVARLQNHFSHGAFSFSTRTLATVYQEIPMYIALGSTGTAAVAALSFCFLLVNASRKLVDALGHNLTPRILSAAAISDSRKLRTYFETLTTFAFVFGGLLSAGIFVYGPVFLSVWLAPVPFVESSGLRLLAMAILILPLGGAVAFFLDGLGKYWRNAKIAALEAILGATMMYLLGHHLELGVFGIVIGFVLPKAVFAIVFIKLLADEIAYPVKDLLWLFMRRLPFALWAYFVCALSHSLLPVRDWPTLITSVFVATSCYVLTISRSIPTFLKLIRTAD